MVSLAALWMRKPAEVDVTGTEVGVEVQAPTFDAMEKPDLIMPGRKLWIPARVS